VHLTPGPTNSIADVAGVAVGSAQCDAALTGVTVVLAPDCVAAGVSAPGGAPGTRETLALSPENLVGRCHAVVLAGGSVFGLAAADAVAAELSARGIGLRLAGADSGIPIPIVPAAVLHDLANGGDKGWSADPPYRRLGAQALAAALAGGAVALGRAGAGHGARAGLERGGLGSASLDLGDGVTVAAIVAVNCCGSVRAPGGGFWASPFEIDAEFGGGPLPERGAHHPFPADSRLPRLSAPASATTIAVVAVNAALTPAQAKRVAIMAQDGVARAVRPAHTPFDGDVVFALALPGPAADTPTVARIGSAAADTLARAIARGVWSAAER
jgi:L-aminopeptidase/D-esterase-like protein